MPASLFGSRFVGVRKPAWHNLGTVIEDAVPVLDALKVAGIDYRYADAPIGFTTPDGEFVSSRKKAILRSPTLDDPQWRELGIVDQKYTYLQNDELAVGLDQVAEKTGWRLETVGALGEGGTVFLTLKMGSAAVAGDQIDSYLLVSDGKASGRALQVSVTNVRVVCANTLMAADAAASTMIKIPHRAGVAQDYAFWTEYVGKVEAARLSTIEQLSQMAAVKISDEQADKVFEAAFPLPNMNERARQAASVAQNQSIDDQTREELMARLQPGVDAYEYWTQWAEQRRNASRELYERFNSGNEQGGQMDKVTLKQVANTPYAALQATTELVDWSGAGSPAGAASSAIFGDGVKIKRRAWSAALALA